MEGWMLTAISIVGGLIAIFSVTRHKVTESSLTSKSHDDRIKELEKFKNENSGLLRHLSDYEEETKAVTKQHAEDIVKLKQQVHGMLTLEQARDIFVAKEIFTYIENNNQLHANINDNLLKLLSQKKKRKR